MNVRSRARGWALQALYAWEMRGGDADTMVPTLHGLFEELRVSPQNRLHAEALIRLTARSVDRVDRILKEHLTNWSLPRLSAIDRNILRLGVVEMLFLEDVAPRVTIREMLRLAEKYSTPESPRFINGVLDAVHRALRTDEAPGTR